MPELLMKKAEEIAKKLGFVIQERSWNKLLVNPHEDSEWVELHWHKWKTVKQRNGFDYTNETMKEMKLDDEDWVCSGFVKTQYAGIETHIKVCEFLRYVASFCQEVDICDEADFYENRDLNGAKESFDSSSKMISSLSAALKDAFGAENVITGDQL
jgi:lipopolysaccharide biosynthesis glycosyltransferase